MWNIWAILKENLLPRPFKIAQSGHTGWKEYRGELAFQDIHQQPLSAVSENSNVQWLVVRLQQTFCCRNWANWKFLIFLNFLSFLHTNCNLIEVIRTTDLLFQNWPLGHNRNLSNLALSRVLSFWSFFKYCRWQNSNPQLFGVRSSSNLLNTRGAAVAQWICLRLPSCHPGFESQAHHLCFYQFKFEFKL